MKYIDEGETLILSDRKNKNNVIVPVGVILEQPEVNDSDL